MIEMNDVNQETLGNPGFEAWCDTEKDMKDAENLYDFNETYFRVKGSGGKYYPGDSSSHTISTSKKIVRLCEYQHPDIIASYNRNPFISIEITNATPYSGANPVQRLPRQVKAAEMGVPNLELAPWISNPTPATARGPKARIEATKLYDVPTLDLFFEHENPDSFNESFGILREWVREKCKKVIKNDVNSAKKWSKLGRDIFSDMEDFCSKAYEPSFRQVEILDDFIKINVDLTGKRRYEDTKTGWETKGTGLLDPYPGYILAYDFLLCRNGPNLDDRDKEIYLHFRKLPRDFPFFEKARKSGNYIYWNLIKKFADKILYKDDEVPK